MSAHSSRKPEKASAAPPVSTPADAVLLAIPYPLVTFEPNFTIRAVNTAAKASLERVADVSGIDPGKLVGASVDLLFRHLDAEKRPKGLAPVPTTVRVSFGHEIFDMTISAADDGSGVLSLGVLTWEVVTEKIRAAQAATRMHEAVLAVRGALDAANRGDLTSAVDLPGSDEASVMARSLGRFLIEVRGFIGTIGETAKSLFTSSQELSRATSQMGENADQTSSKARVMATSAEAVSQNLEGVASGTREMTVAIREISKSVHAAADITRRAVAVAEQATAGISKLGASSAEIGKFVKVIASITHQTNLLALNATIEAARAGVAGQGFAVVANEVKELARATAKATEDINRKVETIQSDTVDATRAIEQICAIIREINGIQDSISSSVEEQSATTNEIGTKVTDAARAGRDIVDHISAVAGAAKGTSAAAESAKNAVVALRKMSADLTDLVSGFVT